ncbi:MAG: hypothetical protein SPJ17_01275 [Anaeroplasma sp.]|uniref:hypothetical protein n=1 Tax=Anaeroplasma sp. TaxID=1872523 RepID=UPI002A920ED5|nr:hypothetical protein [Anaeroplasma sp.]MDY5982319.1 hypothetical protein [Anaeroplasma sp.]
MKTKFISLGVACLSFLALTSCMTRTNVDYSTVRQITKIDTEVSTALNLFYDEKQEDETASKLDEDTKNNTYYDLFVAKDANASLFAYEYDLTTYFNSFNGERNNTVTINTLSFGIQNSDAIYDEEKTQILTQAYDQEKGIGKKLNVEFTITTSKDYSRTISTKPAYKVFKDGEDVSLSIVYMPVYVIHYVSNQPVLKNYVFLPIYATFVTETGKEVKEDGTLALNTLGTIKVVDLDKYFGEAANTLEASKEPTVPSTPVEPEEENNSGLSAGAIVGIVLGSVFGALLILYFLVGFTLYKNGTLNGKFFKAIYAWIKRPKDNRKR